MRGYQVFVDENYIGTEGSNGDPLDGVFNFEVTGGQNHNIRVYDGQSIIPRACTLKEAFKKYQCGTRNGSISIIFSFYFLLKNPLIRRSSGPMRVWLKSYWDQYIFYSEEDSY